MIILLSVEASSSPLGTSFPRGCFPGLMQAGSPQAQAPSLIHHTGKTAHPMPAYARAKVTTPVRAVTSPGLGRHGCIAADGHGGGGAESSPWSCWGARLRFSFDGLLSGLGEPIVCMTIYFQPGDR